MSMLTGFDPLAPEVVTNPYPWYSQLLREGPVHWIPSRELWMIVGYNEVGSVLRDPVVYSSTLGYAAMSSGKMSPDRRDSSGVFGVDMQSLRMLISTDPPDHAPVRRLLSRAFTPKTIAEMEPRLRAMSDDVVAGLVARTADGGADLVSDLAAPFPVTVIAELLGVPSERRADFRRWSDALTGVLSGECDMVAVQAAGAELFAFMGDVVERRQAQPGTDLVSRLVVGLDEGEPGGLSFEDVTMTSILLLAAGNETTTNLLGNAAAAFAAHPDQAEQVWANPELLPAAIEEVLRWDSPVQGMLRTTTRATTLAGIELPAGAVVLVCFGGANRDPAHFDDPDRFDIGRRPGDHFAFGHGIHYCLGASLARLEGRLAFESLLRTGTSLKAAEGAVRTAGFMLRGFTKYPLARSSGADA